MAVVVAVVVAYATLGILTGVGSLRRDDTWTMAMASGVAFPVAWVAWYVRDVLRARRPRY